MTDPVRDAGRRDPPAPRRGEPARLDRSSSAGSRRSRARSPGSRSSRASTAARATRCSCWRSSRRASPPARTSSTSCRWRWRRAGRVDTAARDRPDATSGPSYDALADPCGGSELLRRIETGRRDRDRPRARSRFRRRDGLADAQPRTPTARADGRRAVQLLDRVRRRARAEGVPQARAGHQPRARDAALPDRARVPEHRAAPGLVRVRRPALAATLGVVQQFLPDARDGWELALDELGSRPDALPGAARQPRRRSRPRCTPCSPPTPATRRSRPRSPARRRCRC